MRFEAPHCRFDKVIEVHKSMGSTGSRDLNVQA